jgi:predicted permease
MNTSTLDFATLVICPVIALLAMGNILFRRKFINDEFVVIGSRLVFNIALPALLFTSISQADFIHAANPTLIFVGLIGTLAFFLLLMISSHFFIALKQNRGIVIQGGFRANMGIIGLAYCANTYGNDGLAVASVYLGMVTMLFNVLSVFVLNFYLEGKRSIANHLKGIATNPLVIAIIAALPFSYFSVTLPAIVLTTGEYFAQLTLPLALICAGASLQFRSFRQDARAITLSTLSKCIFYPCLMVGIAYLMGIRGMPLGVILLMSIAPTASASYIMVRALGGDHRLAASIIAMTTVVSLPVTIIAFGYLNTLGLV